MRMHTTFYRTEPTLPTIAIQYRQETQANVDKRIRMEFSYGCPRTLTNYMYASVATGSRKADFCKARAWMELLQLIRVRRRHISRSCRSRTPITSSWCGWNKMDPRFRPYFATLFYQCLYMIETILRPYNSTDCVVFRDHLILSGLYSVGGVWSGKSTGRRSCHQCRPSVALVIYLEVAWLLTIFTLMVFKMNFFL